MNRLLDFGSRAATKWTLVSILVLSFQTTIFNDLRPFGVSLEVMLLVAASSGLARGSEVGAIAGFAAGLMYDLVLTSPLGVCAVVFAIVGYIAGLANSFVHEPTWWSRMLLASVSSTIGMCIMPFAFAMVGIDGVVSPKIVTIALVVGITNGVMSVPMERMCRWALADKQSANL